MSLLLLVGTAVVSFTLGAFTIGMLRVHQEFSAYKDGYADGLAITQNVPSALIDVIVALTILVCVHIAVAVGDDIVAAVQLVA